MGFESAQTNYEGQKGWNDLTPDALMGLAAQKPRGKIRPKRVATPLAGMETHLAATSGSSNHSSPLPMPPLASSGRIGANSQSSGTAPPRAVAAPPPAFLPGPPKAANSSSTVGATSSGSISSGATLDSGELSKSVQTLFAQLVQNPSNLGDTDKQACVSKFELTIHKLSKAHLEFLQHVLQVALQNKLEAKQQLINYGLHNSNVSSWTVPLRKLVEQQA